MMKEYAVFWLANGFSPLDPTKIDWFSLCSLKDAVMRYQDLKKTGAKTLFPIINSIVRDSSNEIILRDVLWKAALNAGVDRDDMLLTATETTGSPTDGLAVARFAKAYPNINIEIYATTPETAAYFEIMYKATAKRIEKCELNFFIHASQNVSQTFQSRLIYNVMRWVTIITNLSDTAFGLWWNVLNFAYSRRLKGFTRTVK